MTKYLIYAERFVTYHTEIEADSEQEALEKSIQLDMSDWVDEGGELRIDYDNVDVIE